MTGDTSAVRPGEEPDVSALAEYLRRELPGGAEAVEIEQFPNGHSNLVYLIRADGREYVLRRPPLGPVPAKAHDMAREFRVLSAVHPHFPEAPRVVLLCEDASVIGATFFLMERRKGVVLRDTVPAEWERVPEHPRLASEAFVDCLVRLHQVDIAAPEVRGVGRPEGFVERQVRGWSERWAAARTEESADMDRVMAWLRSRMPQSPPATLVHNDFKLDNVMFAGSADRVEAVLDWEMATVGDPLADVGLSLCYWLAPDSTVSAISARRGWFTRDQFVDRYAQQTGRDLTGIGYYEVLGVFKLAVILQQIYFRFHKGQTHDERFRDFERRVRGLVRLAAEMAEKQR
jgi:aminoglycoside phosphotransferase (APT) family kinase protein